MAHLDQIYLDRIQALPPAPQVLPELLVLLEESDVDIARVADLIRVDPSLTASVLQRCNNAITGLQEPIEELGQAIARVGFNEICRTVVLVIGESTLSQPQEGYGLGPGDLWEHSVATGMAARALAERSGFHENVVFTAGLLHDIGKLVLSSSFEGAYERILKETGENGRSLLETERLLLGLDHAEAGGRILTEWNFPETLIGAVWHHHFPTDNKQHQGLASCVHMADLIAHQLGYSHGHQTFATRTHRAATDVLGITPEMLDHYVLETEEALEELNMFRKKA